MTWTATKCGCGFGWGDDDEEFDTLDEAVAYLRAVEDGDSDYTAHSVTSPDGVVTYYEDALRLEAKS